ncbi:MAG: TlpA disulfide reductase family protein [Candidatus Alcyoniella australis]|nr:TlpA disulfide reductase family protein [Candidatus Alcyoniella australis]
MTPIAKALPVALICALLFVPVAAQGLGEEAVDFGLKSLEGRTVYLSDFLGEKVILVSFFVTWCKPCEREYPQLEKLYQQYKDQGLVVLGISADNSSSVAQVGPTMRRSKVSYPVLLDQDNQVLAQYNPNSKFPYTLIIAKDKTIQYVHEGFSPGDEQALETKIKQLLEAQ